MVVPFWLMPPLPPKLRARLIIAPGRRAVAPRDCLPHSLSALSAEEEEEEEEVQLVELAPMISGTMVSTLGSLEAKDKAVHAAGENMRKKASLSQGKSPDP